MRVLVVDDDADTRDLLVAILEGAGGEVTAAASAAEGLEAYTRFRPHVVVSDVGMPDEDGYSFVRRLRLDPGADRGRTPAVALTAYSRAGDRAKALAAGFANHLAKPVDPDELVAVVANLAAISGARD